ncbi:MAG: hypothetical protein ACLS37_11280 [Alistipes sp.]
MIVYFDAGIEWLSRCPYEKRYYTENSDGDRPVRRMGRNAYPLWSGSAAATTSGGINRQQARLVLFAAMISLRAGSARKRPGSAGMLALGAVVAFVGCTEPESRLVARRGKPGAVHFSFLGSYGRKSKRNGRGTHRFVANGSTKTGKLDNEPLNDTRQQLEEDLNRPDIDEEKHHH